MYYSRARNTQWTKSPANVPPTAYCKIMDKYFLGGLDADFKDKSSIPQLAYCPLPKVNKWLLESISKNVLIKFRFTGSL